MEEFTAYLYTNENDPVKRIKWITVKKKRKKDNCQSNTLERIVEKKTQSKCEDMYLSVVTKWKLAIRIEIVDYIGIDTSRQKVKQG